jgi:hypothetical protein
MSFWRRIFKSEYSRMTEAEAKREAEREREALQTVEPAVAKDPWVRMPARCYRCNHPLEEDTVQCSNCGWRRAPVATNFVVDGHDARTIVYPRRFGAGLIALGMVSAPILWRALQMAPGMGNTRGNLEDVSSAVVVVGVLVFSLALASPFVATYAILNGQNVEAAMIAYGLFMIEMVLFLWRIS